MIQAVIEPFVLAVPPNVSPSEGITRYIQSLLFWNSSISSPIIKVLYSLGCTNWLMQNNLFPFSHNIDSLLKIYGITEFSSQDISKIATNIFSKCTDIETLINIDTFQGNFDISPIYLIKRLPFNLAPIFRECIEKLAVQLLSTTPELSCICIGSTHDPGNGGQSTLVIDGRIESYTSYDTVSNAGELPLDVHIELPMLFNEEDILNSTSWETIWEYPEYAIKKAYFSTIKEEERRENALGSFKVGDHFVGSIQSVGLHNDSGKIRTIYETCALIICGRAKDVRGINLHALKNIENPRPYAKGMRADISKHGPGYRLHYWEYDKSYIELSKIGFHKDFTIW